jgi:hypothetical protein
MAFESQRFDNLSLNTLIGEQNHAGFFITG